MPEKELKRIRVSPDSAFATALAHAQATGEPVLVDTGKAIYPLKIQRSQRPPTLPSERRSKEDIWANYDAARVLDALSQSAGSLKGIDGEALLKDIYEQREQDTPGRPA